MKNIGLLILLTYYSSIIFSQNFANKQYYLIDSLNLEDLTSLDKELLESSLKAYHKAEEDTNKINAINNICQEMKHNSWIKYNDLLYESVNKKLKQKNSKKINTHLKKTKATTLSSYGFYYDLKGDAEKALDFYNKSLSISDKLGDKKAIAYSTVDIGYIYQIQGNVSKALKYFFKALKILEELKDKKGIAAALNNIGLLFYSQEDFPKALEFQTKSLKYKEELEDDIGIATSLSNIGLIYSHQNDTTQSLIYHHKSLKILEKLGYKHGIASVLYNIGDVYKKQADLIVSEEHFTQKQLLLDKAISYYDKVLKIREEINDKRGLSFCLDQIATIHLDRNNLKEAQNYASKNLTIAQEIGYPENIKRAAKLLSKIYEQQKEGLKALEMHQLFITMRDSLNNIETQKASIEQNMQYEFDKKEALAVVEHEKELAIKEAEKQQQNIIIWAGTIVLILIIGFSLYIANRLKLSNQQKLVIEQKNHENELLLGEIHHRVKNNLQVISSLLSLQERSIDDKATKSAIAEGKERVKSMGLIHKMLYQNDNYSGVEMDNYGKELVKGLIDSFGIKDTDIDVNLNFSQLKLDVDTAIPIGLIINELVINTLKYAFEKTNSPAIKISLIKQSENLILEVSDNGTGKVSDLENSKSFGMKLIKSLSRQIGGIVSINDASGICVSISISDFKLI